MHRGRLARFLRWVEHRFVGKRAGARDDADSAGLKIFAGMMPILHSPAVSMPGQLGRSGAIWILRASLSPDHVEHRNALVIQTIS